MKNLSIGTLVAWQIAAIETGVAKHQYIEKEQILIGICSLEKAPILHRINFNFSTRDLGELKYEYESIEGLLGKYKLNSTYLRRMIRKKFSQGNYKHTEKVIHRSEDCKNYFERADILAQNSDKILCLHLFAAIVEKPDKIINEILKEKDIDPKEIYKKALFFAKINQKNDKKDLYVI